MGSFNPGLSAAIARSLILLLDVLVLLILEALQQRADLLLDLLKPLLDGFRDEGRGFVCAMTALVVKGSQAHIFHVGDTRIGRIRNGEFDALTNDHATRVSEPAFRASDICWH